MGLGEQSSDWLSFFHKHQSPQPSATFLVYGRNSTSGVTGAKGNAQHTHFTDEQTEAKRGAGIG